MMLRRSQHAIYWRSPEPWTPASSLLPVDASGTGSSGSWPLLGTLPVLTPTSALRGAYIILLVLNLLLAGPGSSVVSARRSRSSSSGSGGNSNPLSTHNPYGGGSQAAGVPCNVAQQNCVARIGCGMALHNYLVYCGQVIHGESADVCPPRCRKALVSLLSTEDREGEAFMECSCSDNGYCHTQKRRLEVCSRDVLDAMKRLEDDSIQISCSLAELICRADSSCLAALSYFDQNCGKLQTGEKCTARCNNSLDILLRQRKARKLRTCVCDGTETYACQTTQESIDRLCHHNNRRNRHHHNHTRAPHQHHGAETTALPEVVTPSRHAGTVSSPCNSINTSASGCQPITSSAAARSTSVFSIPLLKEKDNMNSMRMTHQNRRTTGGYALYALSSPGVFNQISPIVELCVDTRTIVMVSALVIFHRFLDHSLMR